jgi:acetolactate synthase-1/2/3 large subunit
VSARTTASILLDETALRRAIAADAPVVIEVPIGDVPNPWKFVQLPKVRG